MAEETSRPPQKTYDYLLKFLLVGDSDVGKQEILSELDDGASESPFCSGSGKSYKTTTILLDGKRVKLQLWDTSGQGRFCTIIRSYSRGAQGVLLVYDITNRWSFDGLDRWLKEVDEHAPGVPKVLVGNRLHMAFNRKVGERDAQVYAHKHSMAFFEVSSLCNFNILESFCELSRMALQRNGMERLWRSNKVLSLQELCCRAIVARTTVYSIEQLPLPSCVKSHLKSYALTTTSACCFGGATLRNALRPPCGAGGGGVVATPLNGYVDAHYYHHHKGSGGGMHHHKGKLKQLIARQKSSGGLSPTAAGGVIIGASMEGAVYDRGCVPTPRNSCCVS